MMPPEGETGKVEDVQVSGTGYTNELLEQNESTTSVRVGPMAMSVSNTRLAFIGQLIASIVLLIAVTSGYEDYDDDNKKAGARHLEHYEYAISASVVAMVINLAILMKPDITENVQRFPFFGTDVSGISVILVAWWTIAVGVLTYNAPFVVTGNGYFATWSGFLFSMLGLGITGDRIKGALTNLYMGLCICSIVVICAIPKHWSGKEYGTETVFTLAVSLGSLAITGFVMHSNQEGVAYPAIIPPLLFLLATLWTVAACLATFRGPFLTTGNGYFGVWGGCTLTLIAVDHSLHNKDTEGNDQVNNSSASTQPENSMI